MKKRKGSIFFRGFIKTFSYVCAFAIVFLVSYKCTGVYLEGQKGNGSGSNKTKMELKGSVDPVSFNLIISLDETSKELEHVVLETLNTKNDTLMYITIPMDAEFSMSTELYQQVCAKTMSIPQIIRFDKLKDYMEPNQSYDFCATLFEDVFHHKISYCTVISADMFDDIFKEQDGCLALSNSVKKAVEGYQEPDIVTYVKDFYENVYCNLTMEQRLTYTPALSKVSWEDIIYTRIPGEEDSSGLQIDIQAAEEFLNAVKEGRSPEEIKGVTGNVEPVSLGRNIRVLNGSGINGLASQVKTQLESNGYTVTGIGNYSRSDVMNSVIQVREDGLGNDLLSYLHGATVEIGEDMPEGVDIQIVLGKSESVSA